MTETTATTTPKTRETELDVAIKIADRILNLPHGDPDDDLAILSRQLTRAVERISNLKQQEDLFAKYMDHIGQCCGHVYLFEEIVEEGHPYPEKDSKVKFTNDEMTVLHRIARMKFRKPLPTGRYRGLDLGDQPEGG